MMRVGVCLFVLMLTASSVQASGNKTGIYDTAKDLACKILNQPKITLLAVNPSRIKDGADALSNIRDTCNGQKAKRSNYCCTEGCAPGGYVNLKTSVLNYVLDLANNEYKIQANSFAGACHSTKSLHYEGKAVDLQVRNGDPWKTWMKYCAAHGAKENLGPDDPGHSNHTHCGFRN